jgi:hypothetical protein
VHDAAYGGCHFIEWPDTHRDDADLARENDRVPIRTQSNLELIEEKKFRNVRCALRQQCCHIAGVEFSAHASGRPEALPGRWAFPLGRWIALG